MLTPSVCIPDCLTDLCPSVFDYVSISNLIRGGTVVNWRLRPDFADPLPHQFQLQVGHTDDQTSDDWVDVGLSMSDSTFAIDDQQRVYGKSLWSHYRVRLMTPLGTYLSQPVMGLGVLDRRSWRFAREVIRKERLRFGLASPEGYLLQTKHFGPPCPDCLDFQLDECRRPDCPLCFGTGFLGGYYAPLPCVYADTSEQARHVTPNTAQGRGTVDDAARIRGRMLAAPYLNEMDVWVNKKTDERWFIHEARSVAEIRGVPLVVTCELRLIPFSHIVYTFPIPGQED